MNYGEIKHNLISLVFGETSDLEEVEELGYLYDAVNRAISQIGVQFPYIDKYEFDIDLADAEDGDFIYIDMTDVDERFLEFADTPVLFEKNGKSMFTRFSSYDIETDSTIVIDPSGNDGSYRIYYKKKCEDFTESTEDTDSPELPLKAHFLIPPLAAYWLWLDDDDQKATQYLNIYEQNTTSLIEKMNKPTARVVANEWGVI